MADYRAFIGGSYISHSAKGSSWKNHKYIKKINGIYYYTREQLNKAGKNMKEYLEDRVVSGEVERVGGKTTKDTRVYGKDVMKKASDSMAAGKKRVNDAVRKVSDIKLASSTHKDARGVTTSKTTTVGSLARKGSNAIKRLFGVKKKTRFNTNKRRR